MATIWELDFYSRPILDEKKKKLWEVLICEAPLNVESSADNLFKYSEFTSNTTVNSLWLQQAIEKAIAIAPEPPKKIRFFRRQMKNMISKACEEIGLVAAPSRRTYTLNQWIEQRMVDFYPTQEGYDAISANSDSVQYPELDAIGLPEALRADKGDKWAFVSLEAAAFAEMNEWDIGFSEAFPLSLFSIEPDTKIPGLIIFSNRALALAGWMSGLEMAYIKFETSPRPFIRLETGASDSWILANITGNQLLSEAKGFEEAKQKTEQVHFLAIQPSTESESFAGFWLLKG